MTFSRIYESNAWNGTETRSGPGSCREPTRRVANTIVDVIEWLEARSVLDVGCGEGLWMPALPGYLGVDVAPEAIDVAQRNHPDRRFMVWDVVHEGFIDQPGFDVVIVRDVIQHLSLADGRTLLGNLSYRWLLASTYTDGDNIDIETGDAYRPNLEREPFELGPAMSLIHDGYAYHDGDTLRDPGKMLGLWRS